MTYEDFIQHLTKNVMHEARYQDSEGRSILVICVADAYDMVKNAIKEEREACARVCEEAGSDADSGRLHIMAYGCARKIRARGEK